MPVMPVCDGERDRQKDRRGIEEKRKSAGPIDEKLCPFYSFSVGGLH